MKASITTTMVVMALAAYSWGRAFSTQPLTSPMQLTTASTQPTEVPKQPTTAPTRPTTAATKPVAKIPDLCKGAIDPYEEGRERTRFFRAAGVDGELDANEFAADFVRPNGFVRKFDRWGKMLDYDKNANKATSWSEAEAYRADIRKRVFAVFDTNKDGKLKGTERDVANRALAAGRISPATTRPVGLWRWTGSVPPETFNSYGTRSSQEWRAARERMGEWRTRMLEQYDVDEDGKISDEEARPIRREWRERRQGRQIERYDADGDGQLDEVERKVMEEDRREGAGRWRETATEWQLRLFDDDGDGELSEKEETTSLEFRQKVGQVFRDLRTRSMDTDGDGEISDEERSAARRGRMAAGFGMMAGIRRQMDTDGDGEVTDAEREAFRENIRARMQRRIDQFVEDYDGNRDGRLGPAEREAFMVGLGEQIDARYRAADIDGDDRLGPNEMRGFREDIMRDIGVFGTRDMGVFRPGRRGQGRSFRRPESRPTSLGEGNN